ncbi:MAG: DUF3795 domain-containing protein [Sideroxyarcus sp.]|nr:DUF3795 domain-containing protein [Sideroxyarcus sp.]
MSDIKANAELVAYCGLYCGACKSYLGGKCLGCHENASATWCKVRSCCTEKQIKSCAECVEFPDPKACKKFNNIVSRLFGLVFKSDRAACIAQIKRLGLEGHAKSMAEMGAHTLKR